MDILCWTERPLRSCHVCLWVCRVKEWGISLLLSQLLYLLVFFRLIFHVLEQLCSVTTVFYSLLTNDTGHCCVIFGPENITTRRTFSSLTFFGSVCVACVYLAEHASLFAWHRKVCCSGLWGAALENSGRTARGQFRKAGYVKTQSKLTMRWGKLGQHSLWN